MCAHKFILYISLSVCLVILYMIIMFIVCTFCKNAERFYPHTNIIPKKSNEQTFEATKESF